jgi:hypothetical protein
MQKKGMKIGSTNKRLAKIIREKEGEKIKV